MIYPSNDNADLDKRMKEVQIATQMHSMGFQVRIDEETSELVYSGESQAPQPDMGGFGEDDEGFDDFGDEGDYQDELLLGKSLQKGKTYINSPDDAPKGAKVQRGPKGGYFYETSAVKPEKKEPRHTLTISIKQQTERYYLTEQKVIPVGITNHLMNIYELVKCPSGICMERYASLNHRKQKKSNGIGK